mgnify:CR=1 FL=1
MCAATRPEKSDHDLGADLHHAAGRQTEITRGVRGAARQRQKEMILPERHTGFARRHQRPPREEERRLHQFERVALLAGTARAAGRFVSADVIGERPVGRKCEAGTLSRRERFRKSPAPRQIQRPGDQAFCFFFTWVPMKSRTMRTTPRARTASSASMNSSTWRRSQMSGGSSRMTLRLYSVNATSTL